MREAIDVISKSKKGDVCGSARDVCDRLASYRVDDVPLCIHHASRFLTNADLLSLFARLTDRIEELVKCH
jgi:hypothetical protein